MDGAGGSKHSNIWAEENGVLSCRSTNHIQRLSFCLYHPGNHTHQAILNDFLIPFHTTWCLQKNLVFYCLQTCLCRFASQVGWVKCLSTTMRAPTVCDGPFRHNMIWAARAAGFSASDEVFGESQMTEQNIVFQTFITKYSVWNLENKRKLSILRSWYKCKLYCTIQKIPTRNVLTFPPFCLPCLAGCLVSIGQAVEQRAQRAALPTHFARWCEMPSWCGTNYWK